MVSQEGGGKKGKKGREALDWIGSTLPPPFHSDDDDDGRSGGGQFFPSLPSRYTAKTSELPR